MTFRNRSISPVGGRVIKAGAVLTLWLVVLIGLAAGNPLSSAQADQPNTPPVIAREGSKTSPVKPSVNPARDLRQAYFRLDMVGGGTLARISLEAAPTAATTSNLTVMWGTISGDTCQVASGSDTTVATDETGVGDPGDDYYWKRTGGEIEMFIQFYGGWEDFNCAVAVTLPPDAGEPDPSLAYDFIVVDLNDVRAAPQGQLKAKVIGDVSAYAGATTKVRVKVSNPGTGPVTGARLKLTGPKLRIPAKKLGEIGAGKSRVVALPVRARPGKRFRKVEVIATGRGPAQVAASSRATFEVRTRGRKPRAGSYVGNNGRVSFQLTPAGVVKKIRFRVVGVCNPGAYTWAEWKTLPKARVNKFGWVDKRYKRGKGYDWSITDLTARFVGGKVLQGHYQYWTGLCEAEVKFKARRVGG